MKMQMNEMHSIVSHHRLVYQLHTIIRHAASKHHRMIHRLFRIMKRKGFATHHITHLKKESKRILKSFKKLSKSKK